jgi:ferredoxin
VARTQVFAERYGIENDEALQLASIQWVLQNPDMHTACISAWNFDFIDKIVALSGTRLTAPADRLLQESRSALDTQYCRHGCVECMDSCPCGVPVSKIMRFAYYFEGQGRERHAMSEYAALDGSGLWEYIDGAAVLFVEYGVRTCSTADMAAAGVSVTVDLYDMASPLGAVGVFKRESSGGGVNLADATIAAVSPPYLALMVKGSTYAKVNASDGELTESAGSELLQGLAASLPGEAVMPQELLAELTECVYADYEGSEGETWQGFVVLPSAASTVWDALVDRWQSFEHNGHTVLFREVPYSGLVGVTRTDSGMFGVSGAADETQLRERLGGFASLR